jgi:hypothetical protein
MSGGPIPGPALTGLLTPHDNFPGRSLTRFGVGEIIGLSFAASPQITAAALGGLRWSIQSGRGTLTENLGNDGRATFTAPDRAGQVTLVLKALSSGAAAASLTITIVEPEDGVEVQKPGTALFHRQGSWSCGFLGEIFLRPVDVSFCNIAVAEGQVLAVATGFLQTLNGSKHTPNPPSAVGNGNAITGCKLVAPDDVRSGQLPEPFFPGDFVWRIPWNFMVGSSGSKQFAIAEHHATADAQGRATISKKGAGPFSRLPSDPSSENQ